MKRKITGISLAVLLAVSALLPMAALAAGSFKSSDAAFKVGSSTYSIGTTSTGWKDKLGKYTKKESDGCTLGESSYLYNFSSKGVKVETLYTSKTKKETVISVVITGTSVGTAGGLKVGADVSKMTDIYGTKYKQSGSTYTYSAGSMRMVISTSKDVIKKITIYK